MTLSFRQKTVLTEMAKTLYEFLPASGNNNASFPSAARKVDLAEFWQHNSKLPAILNFLSNVLERKGHKLVPFLEEVVTQSLVWRSKGNSPLARREVEQLNKSLSDLGYKSIGLSDPVFLASLPVVGNGRDRVGQNQTNIEIQKAEREDLAKSLMEISILAPQKRGFAFEKFLNRLFISYGLHPNNPFRLIGEQIDGSFTCAASTYLLEAKWVAFKIGQEDLLVFKGKVDGKAAWSRGLIVAVNGFSDDGLLAFRNGKPTNIICMDGHDIHLVLQGEIDLASAIELKARRAAETNRAFVPIREMLR